MDFGNRIKLVRETMRLSQEAFAKEFGVSFATINRWERGYNQPNYKYVLKLDELIKQYDKENN